MNETKYTKGPWRWVAAFEGARDKNSLVDSDGKSILSPVAGFDRADLGLRIGDWNDKERSKQLTALIAAAPELYEALSMAFESILKYDPRDPVLAHIHKALGKAEGRL